MKILNEVIERAHEWNLNHWELSDFEYAIYKYQRIKGSDIFDKAHSVYYFLNWCENSHGKNSKNEKEK